MNEEPKILPGDYCDKESYKVGINQDDEDNPRLRFNLPADKLFIEVTKTQPPYLVVVVRADRELVALGLLEKAKVMLMQFQLNLTPALSLTRGVMNAVPFLRGKA